MKIYRCILTAAIDFQFEIKPVAFIERAHSSTFHSADVYEGIRLAIVTLNEAEALHGIEEFYGTARLLAGQLALRAAIATGTAAEAAAFPRSGRRAFRHRQGFALNLEISGGYLAAAIDQREFQRLSFRQAGKPSLLDCADVHEHIFAAIVPDDETETLLAIEEFYDALALAHYLGRHSASTTAAAAWAAEAATAAETAAISSESAAVTKTAAKTPIISEPAAVAAAAMIRITAVTFVAETVSLVLAAPAAATSVKTHALLITFASSKPNEDMLTDESHTIPAAKASGIGFGIADFYQPRELFYFSVAAISQNWSFGDAVASIFACRDRPEYCFRMSSSAFAASKFFGNLELAAFPGFGQSNSMTEIFAIFADPAVWAALTALVVMEVVLGIDNLIFISILSNKLPVHQQSKARRLGIGLALVLRLGLLSGIAWLVGLTAPLFDLGLSGPIDKFTGHPVYETTFSARDLILIAGGLFLVWKATKEIHHNVDVEASGNLLDKKGHAAISFGSVIFQILLLDMVFSIDSILTAVGMTDHLPVMVIAVIVAVGVMLLAADPLARFIDRNPTVVMLALGFLLMIGAVLIADGFGVHVPKGYIYAAMAFSAFVEILNILGRRARAKKGAEHVSETVH